MLSLLGLTRSEFVPFDRIIFEEATEEPVPKGVSNAVRTGWFLQSSSAARSKGRFKWRSTSQLLQTSSKTRSKGHSKLRLTELLLQISKMFRSIRRSTRSN
ncbi:hypothetical protein SLA2020_450560 [Shorea laevis]